MSVESQWLTTSRNLTIVNGLLYCFTYKREECQQGKYISNIGN